MGSVTVPESSRQAILSDTNIVMKNAENDYERRLFLRFPPQLVSTKETRNAGLNAVRDFLMDGRFSRYPPSSIDIRDLTDYDTSDDPQSMDQFMMNSDIKEAIIQECSEVDLDEEFFENFPETARNIWQSPHFGDYGATLGF